MIGNFFHVTLYQPLYNALVFLVSIIPFGDLGLAVIVLTLIVKIVLFPVSHKSIKTQAQMRTIEPEVKKLKEQYKKDKQEQARRVMELYKKHGLNPFSGCVFLIIQLPIIIALYWVFWKGLSNGFDPEILYSFVTLPTSFNVFFLGFIDVLGKSFLLALGAGISQYFQMKLSVPKFQNVSKPGDSSLKTEFAKSFNLQMRYGLPVFVAIISYTISSAVALYWLTSNLFSIGHELYVRKQARKIVEQKKKNDEA